MKQTAVEWLVEQIFGDHTEQWQKEIQQATEMEKEQIENAYLKNHLQGCWMKNTPEEYAEQYYNENYNLK